MEKRDDKKSAKQKRPRMPFSHFDSSYWTRMESIKGVSDNAERIIARNVRPSKFSKNGDRLVYFGYTLRSELILDLNPEYFRKVDMTYILKEDKNGIGKELNFKFCPPCDLERFVKAVRNEEAKYEEIVFPQKVQASDLKLIGKRLYYGNYFLSDRRLAKLDPEYLPKVTGLFTIGRDINGGPRFRFRPEKDLSEFIEAVRLAKENDKIDNFHGDSNYQNEVFSKPAIPEAEYFPTSGIFCLPWEYVTFYEGRMLLKHPKTAVSATLHPFIFSHQLIHKSFNDMKEYFKKSCEPLKVVASGGEIKELLNFIAFIKFIRELNTYSGNTEADYEIKDGKALKPGSTLTLNELRNRRVIKKSPYISMLSKIHVSSLPIYYLLENVVHRSSEFSSEEHGYLFAIRQSMGEVIAVYENISDDSRASMVFRCSSHRYDEAVKWISTFLSSEVENKRELIARGQIRVSNSMVRDLMRVLHTDQDRWRTQILNLRLYGF